MEHMRDYKGRFIKGHKGIKNKGRSGLGPNRTSFKKGNIIGEEYRIKKGERRSPQTQFKKGEHRNIRTEFKKGQTPWIKGMRGINAGEKSHFWKGGITPINFKIRNSSDYKLWRFAVFKRDNYTCVWCGVKSEKGRKVFLHADHIKPFALFPELRFAIDNGRTLCADCHKKTPSYLNRWI